MSKIWNNPMAFFDSGTENNGNPTVIGKGSGQSTVDIEPYDYEFWYVTFEDQPGYGSGSWDDYVKWMTDNGFADWISILNPDMP